MSGHRIMLHVGTPKSGTSYLQDVLFRNRKRLALQGIHYPAERFDSHFLAALDLMRLPWGGLETEAIGAWDRLADEARGHRGTTIVSHEILARASRSQVSRALESLGHGAGGSREPEVHVVLSVRDLERQIPAEWQENVKHRSVISYRRFLEQIRDPDRGSPIAAWFWGVQEIPAILDRWAHDLPPERVHLVVVPRAEATRDVLWSRFLQVFGLDGVDLELGTGRLNSSLGVPETALVRRVNREVNRQLPPADYRRLVRELVVHQNLSLRDSERLVLPPELHPWARDLQQSWIAEIDARGYDVVGDLAELVGTPPATWSDPDQPREKDVAAAAVVALKALLLENAAATREQERLRGELDRARADLERSYLRPTYRLREKVVRRLQTTRAGDRVLSAYRWVRRRARHVL